MKKLFLPFLIVAIVLVSITLPDIGEAKSLDQINRELRALEREKAAAAQRAKDAKTRIGQIQIERDNTKKEIDVLLAEIDKENKELKQINTKITSTEADLAQSEKDLKEAEERVIARDELIQSRLRLMYTNGSVSYVEVLLSATSFSDFLDRFNGLHSLVGQDKEILDANKRDHELMAAKRTEIAGQLTQLTVLYTEQEAAIEKLWVKEKNAEVMIASLNKEEEHLEHISEEEEEKLNRFLREETKLLREKNQIITYYQGGKLGYPLPKAYRISSNFGYRISPITGKKGELHKGMDFAAPAGTSILAAESGVVVTAGWWGGYGNTVVIDHGGGLQTLYAHARANGIKVKKGQKVKRGDKISEVGTTGSSTGNHLHFEVRKNEKPVDPRGFLKL